MARPVTLPTLSPKPTSSPAAVWKNTSPFLRSDRDVNDKAQVPSFNRRGLVLTLTAVAIGLGSGFSDANAAARRPPPPPPAEEKNDPNVSGVLAKVLASKKRREAFKESMAKLREKGKPVGPSRAE